MTQFYEEQDWSLDACVNMGPLALSAASAECHLRCCSEFSLQNCKLHKLTFTSSPVCVCAHVPHVYSAQVGQQRTLDSSRATLQVVMRHPMYWEQNLGPLQQNLLITELFFQSQKLIFFIKYLA